MANGSSDSSSIVRSLNDTQRKLQQNFVKLSSGKRINSAADDAAGLAIAEALKSDAVVLKQANRNIGDAQSVVEITDGALQQVGDITVRLQELATQASNGTLSDGQRASLNNEFQQLTQEVQRIGATTEFNGQQLLSGNSVTVQAGTDASANSQISAGGVDISTLVSSLASQAIGTADSARSALDSISSFANSITTVRGNLGASSARLEVASSNNESQRLNSLSAESRIRDVDVADAAAQNVALRIREQTSTALLAQSNLSSSKVQDLLK